MRNRRGLTNPRRRGAGWTTYDKTDNDVIREYRGSVFVPGSRYDSAQSAASYTANLPSFGNGRPPVGSEAYLRQPDPAGDPESVDGREVARQMRQRKQAANRARSRAAAVARGGRGRRSA